MEVVNEVRVVSTLNVVNRNGKVVAQFQGETGPDGCGVVTKLPVQGNLMNRGFRGLPLGSPDKAVSELCKAAADAFLEVYGNQTMRVVPAAKSGV